MMNNIQNEQNKKINSTEPVNIIELTANVVSAYIRNNTVAANDLPNLIADVHTALGTNSFPGSVMQSNSPRPAVPVKKSLTDDYLICLEDGKKFKSLKRHLRTHYNLSPEKYREKWGLAPDYPMVAPNYAAARSRLAYDMGLGRKRKKKT